MEIATGGIDAGVSGRGLDQVDRGAAVEGMTSCAASSPEAFQVQGLTLSRGIRSSGIKIAESA